MSNYNSATNKQVKVHSRFEIKHILTFLILISTLFIIINAALPRLEMLLFSGNVPLYSVFLKFSIILYLVIYIIIDSRARIDKTSIIVLTCFICYLSLDALIFSVTYNYSLKFRLFGYNSMYFILILVLFYSCIRSNVSAEFITKYLIIISIPLVALGISQTVFNNSILSLQSSNGYFKVLAWDYYGQVRAFSAPRRF